MKLISLTKGMFAKVDDEDFERINNLCSWYSFKHGRSVYARGGIHDKDLYRIYKIKKSKYVSMHREILNLKDPKTEVDHIDSDGLNNQKSNLRICLHYQNLGNRRKKINSTSRFKGVFFNKNSKKFIASIGFNGKTRRIGQYDSEVEAALAYNVAASFKFREFAKLNIIPL